jgi:fructose transport system permease protein
MKDKLPPIGQLGPFIALLIACVFFGLTTDRFFSGENFSLILQQIAVVGVIAIGQTLIILTAGIDLSCGMVMALGSIVMTKFAADLGMPPALAVLCGIAATAAFGLVNGLLVTKIKLPPFIVTLGTFNIAFAITQLYSNAQTVTDVPPLMTWLGNTFPMGSANVAYGTVLMILLYLGVWFWLRETAAGRHVYAVGNNPEATRLTGIPTDKVLLAVYVTAGLFYGIAALLSVARTAVGDPNAGQTENLDAITAVVLGGTSLFGGRGIILGTLLGAVIVGVFRNGLTLMGVSSVYQVLITGVLVILAVATDQLSRKGAR